MSQLTSDHRYTYNFRNSEGFHYYLYNIQKHTDRSGEEVLPEAFTLDPFYTVEIGSQFIIYF